MMKKTSINRSPLNHNSKDAISGKKEKLLHAIGQIDDSLLADALDDINLDTMGTKNYAPRQIPKFTFPVHRAAIAACLCFMTFGALYGLGMNGKFSIPSSGMPHAKRESIPENKQLSHSDSTGQSAVSGETLFTSSIRTSDTYETLEELLSYLSRHDGHNSRSDGSQSITPGLTASVQSVAEGSNAIVHAGYAYHLGDSMIHISKLENDPPEKAGNIPFTRELNKPQLFLYGDTLVLTGSFISDGSELDRAYSTCVRLYDLSNPEAPELTNEYIQLGEHTACYLDDEFLYLLTEDGICACGWSRLQDPSQYYPQLSRNGEEIPWTDEEIHILDTPTNVQYVAAARINLNTGEIAGKQAFYGDIQNVFYGPQWLALVTWSRTDSLLTQPHIYTFEPSAGFLCTGKTELAEKLELRESIPLNEGRLTEESFVRILSMTKSGNTYRLVGELTKAKSSNAAETSLLVMTLDDRTGEHRVATTPLDLENRKFYSIDDLLWEDNRAIISVANYAEQNIQMVNYFLFAEFTGPDILLSSSQLTADRVCGVDGMYAYGKPFGSLDTLLPMGDGIYLRYNQTPDGLDIYDFSDSNAPRRLYLSAGDIPKECRFAFTWKIYDEQTFGIMVVTPDREKQFRNAEFTWRIYAISTDMDNPYTILAEYSLGKGGLSFLADSGFAAFEYAGRHYFVDKQSGTATLLEW